ncbi:MAG: hypothetical protein NC411_05655 [Bacteroides sp.]|nr:hypothetical protein [Bacteroides sp.]
MNANVTRQPDFAYPKTVSMDAEKELCSALAAKDGPRITRALMNYYLAQASIDATNCTKALARIDSIATVSTDPVLKAMLLTLQADIYNAIYSSSRWKYDSRDIPLSPVQSDIYEWSGGQFRLKISSLAEKALSYQTSLRSAPITSYSSVIGLAGDNTAGHQSQSVQRLTELYYPTLYDFVAYRSINLLTSCGNINTLLSWGLLTRHDIYVSLPFTKHDPIVAKILEIYASLLRFHEPGSAPFINTDLNRLNFISSHIYDDATTSGQSLDDRRFALMQSMYDENQASEYSGDILLNIPRNDANQCEWLYTAVNHNLTAFPAYPQRNALLNIRLSLEEQNVTLSYPEIVAPGAMMSFKINAVNVKSGKIYIYNVSSSPITDRSYNCKGLPEMKPLAVVPFSIAPDAEVPFRKSTEVNFTFEEPGNYIAIATIDGLTLKDRRWYDKINVTHYALAVSEFEKNTIWALDAMTGAPVNNAEISILESRRQSDKLRSIGRTNGDGALDVNLPGNVFMTKNGDRFTPSVWINARNKSQRDTTWRKAASGYSALSLYHPGDSVNWMSILYEYRGDAHRSVISQAVKAFLRDASYNVIDSLDVTTDEFGRVEGTFKIPDDCLTGRFNISIDKYSNPVSFMVSDYKLPTFKVILDPVEKDCPIPGAVTVRGNVETYAGFPVGDARLTVELSASSRSRWWWNRQSGMKFYTLTSTTDPEGLIEIVIPKDVLEMSPIPDGIFSVSVAALSPAGETQTASTSFANGTRYIIKASVPENIDITSPTLAIKAQVVNFRDSIIAMPVNYTIYRDKAKMMSGILTNKNVPIDLASLSSGKYRICFTLPDKALADSVTNDVVLYRPTDNETPCPGELLWYPHNAITVSSTTPAKWLYAVDCNTNLLVTIHSEDTIISRKWISTERGMHRLPVFLPDSIEKAVMEIALTGNYRTANARIDIHTDKKPEGLRFIIESFRNRLMPGSEETWTFRVVDESDKGKRAAVILDMYNAALDALVTQNWTFNPVSWGPRYYYNWYQTSFTGRGQNSYSHIPGKYLKTIRSVQPEFYTYGLSLYPNSLRLRGTRMLMSKAENLDAVKEHKEAVYVEEAYAVNQSMDAGAAMDMMATAGNIAATADMDEETATDNADTFTATESPFTFRDRESTLSFFKPMLTTDSNGHLSFTFTVPNANTTWAFKAIAYTDSLLSTNFSADIIASKPIMVQPNLPRYARAGDTVVIPASVMNNSDVEQTIKTTIEIFNVSDGKVTDVYTHSDKIPAAGSLIVSTMVTAPSDAPFIGYRIKSETGYYADGEQTLLAILPAVSPVIDSYPFYIAPRDGDFSMALPPVPNSAVATLQFCNNPVWYIVTALPGILDIEASTANEAAASIFSTAIAIGVMRDNPAIVAALKEWNSSGRDDKTLTSMLDKNEDLKQILLNASPWMLDAKDDTERMTRLALIFDENLVNSTLNANIATLRKLTRNNGGWAWNSHGNEASQWATENVLMLMGQLIHLGYLPDSAELRKMINDALVWIDAKAKETYRKYPKTDFTHYVYLRDKFKDLNGAPDAVNEIVNTTVQRILANWKSASIFDKGIYAQILAKNSYPTVAKTILSSLREFSDHAPTKGMWWPSLDDMTIWSMGKVGTTAMLLETFAMIEPTCSDIDDIRQWLILQKEANDWGTSVTASNVIAAILSTSPKWVEPAKESHVSVAGRHIEIDKVERLTGYFRTQLPLDEKSKGELKVTRSGDTPSWGALYYLYTDSMTSVKAHNCPELAIDKKFSVGGKYTDSFKVGDKVSVTLTLQVNSDMDYVTIIDERPACYEPVEQMPAPIFAEGIYFYRENRDSSTRMFIDHLPKGTYILTYDLWVNNAGSFASGIATVQSQYAPQFIAHTAGTRVEVRQ